MQITRKNYEKLRQKLIPLLTLAYFIQSVIYLHFAPQDLAVEIVAFLGVSLIGVFIISTYYDRLYQENFYPHYFEIGFVSLGFYQTYSYKEVIRLEIQKTRAKTEDILITLRNGKVLKLSHVDQAQEVKQFLSQKMF